MDLTYVGDDGRIEVLETITGEEKMADIQETLAKKGTAFLMDYLKKKKLGAQSDLYRFLGMLTVTIACIILIGLDIERTYFVSILTFMIGWAVDSPLNSKSGIATPHGSLSGSLRLEARPRPRH